MARKFANITFTPSVRAAQNRYGSREFNEQFEYVDDPHDGLGLREIAFIGARDGFYQSTVNEDGWPYVQFRGGPTGFLRVLDAKTLGYADFRGNTQYLSVGNFAVNDRVSIILMDYANRARLKIWGRVRIVHGAEEPDLMERLAVTGYKARIERGIIITMEAFDWNCPQHITPRFTEAEIAARVQPLHDRIAGLEAALKSAEV